tara:strand:- start:2162 stop:3052 length:891 start_codon:yes stop_codon:yes gene_type:complete
MYQRLKTCPFLNKIIDQQFESEEVQNALHECSKNCPFSTFPYSIKGNITSKESLKKYGCGNCITLSMYIRDLLKKRLGLKSYLIPATIPKAYQKPGYLEISHVALAIPKSKHEIFIADPAFYFTHPISFDDNNYPKTSTNVNIWNDTIDNFDYTKGVLQNKFTPNKWQRIPKKTNFLECSYHHDPLDKWRYFLREIKNPDQAITSFFIRIRKEPWITTLDDEYRRKYLIKRLPGDNILIKKYNDVIYNGPLTDIPPYIDIPKQYLGNLLTGKIKNYSCKKKTRRHYSSPKKLSRKR